MGDEASIVLQALRDELGRQPQDVVGTLSVGDGTMSAMDGKLRLSAVVHRDVDAHPAVAHSHILAEIGFGDQAARLDACVVGVDAEREKALAASARSWVDAVAGPVFSLLHARPVLGASHFDGTEAWGVAGCHGFVGAMVARMFEREVDLSPLADAPVFDYVAELAPPGVVHLAKVTLEATGWGWRRNIEIDGHQAAYLDADWGTAQPGVKQGLVSQFAVFHYADRPHVIEERRWVDEAIREFVAAFGQTGKTDVAADALTRQGFEAKLVAQVARFVPLALARVIFGRMGPRFSADYTCVRPDGSTQNLKLMRQAAFARAMALGPKLLSGPLVEAAKNLAMTSPEFNAINSALHAGSKPEDLVLSPPIVPEAGVSQEMIDQATRRLPREATAPAKARTTKPWWRLW